MRATRGHSGEERTRMVRSTGSCRQRRREERRRTRTRDSDGAWSVAPGAESVSSRYQWRARRPKGHASGSSFMACASTLTRICDATGAAVREAVWPSDATWMARSQAWGLSARAHHDFQLHDARALALSQTWGGDRSGGRAADEAGGEGEPTCWTGADIRSPWSGDWTATGPHGSP